jgi:alkylation response protein AidB-like acyl-CoA dehydrogenase
MSDVFRRVIADIRELGPKLSVRAPDIEAGRRMPPDIVAQLREIGVFRIVTPRSHGGAEFTLRECCDVIAETARIDGAVGWVTLIGAISPAALGLLPPPIYDEIYKDGPDVIVAGSGQPAGAADQTAGGYRVNGRWPFASGCQHADWIFAFCLETKDGSPVPTASGAPPLRIVMLPARQWAIEDTWRSEGLKGTGSHHISLKDVFVPEANLVDFLNAQPNHPSGMLRGGIGTFVTTHGPFATGLAEGAIEDFAALANTGKRPVFGQTAIKDSKLVQYDLGRAEADLRAANALLHEQCEADWRDALAGRVRDFALTTTRFQSIVWVTAACARVVDECYRLAGGSSVYESSPLQRRMRDIRAATQHASVNLRHYAVAGAQRLGHPPIHPLFA